MINAKRGDHYRLVATSSAGQESLLDDVIAVKEGHNLVLKYADDTQVALKDYYLVCKDGGCEVTLPGEGIGGYKIDADGAPGAALDNGSLLIYVHGSHDALIGMVQGDAALNSALMDPHGGFITYVPPIVGAIGASDLSALVLGMVGTFAGVASTVSTSNQVAGVASTVSTSHQVAGAVSSANIASGYVSLGPVVSGNSLSVELYQGDGVTLLGSATLDADGRYTIDMGSYKGVVIAKLINSNDGVDYMDEATGVAKDLTGVMTAVMVSTGGTCSINVNPVTTIAAIKAGLNADGSGSIGSAQLVLDANTDVASALGLGDIHLISPTLIIAASGGTNTLYITLDGTSTGEKYGAVLAALSGADSKNGGNVQTTVNRMVDSISDNSMNSTGKAILVYGALGVSDSLASVFASEAIAIILDAAQEKSEKVYACAGHRL